MMRIVAKTVDLVLSCALLAGFVCRIAEAGDGLPEGTAWVTPQSIVAASGPAYGTWEQPAACRPIRTALRVAL